VKQLEAENKIILQSSQNIQHMDQFEEI